MLTIRRLKNSLSHTYPPLVVNGKEEWNLFSNKSIDSSILILKNISDYNSDTNRLYQHNCSTLILDNCNKNFVYRHLDTITFPQVELIYLLSHPCEPNVFHRWLHYVDNNRRKLVPSVFLSEDYLVYKKRWISDIEEIKIITDYEVNELRKKYHF